LHDGLTSPDGSNGSARSRADDRSAKSGTHSTPPPRNFPLAPSGRQPRYFCPSGGLLTGFRCLLFLIFSEKYCCHATQIQSTTSPSNSLIHPTIGAYSYRHGRGRGAWTQQCWACDASAGADCLSVTVRRCNDGRACGLSRVVLTPRPGVNSCVASLLNRAGQNLHCRKRRWHTSPESPGSSTNSRKKPLLRERRVIPVYSLLLVCVLPLPLAHEAAGAKASVVPHALLGGRFNQRLVRIARARSVNGCLVVIAQRGVARMRAL